MRSTIHVLAGYYKIFLSMYVMIECIICLCYGGYENIGRLIFKKTNKSKLLSYIYP